ncbi:MAG: pbuG [Bacillales bacterium]|jgi:AGZA family xanthine/uracil permease-like MFS transporter|nr:pbuG [Bacillales bacterium]
MNALKSYFEFDKLGTNLRTEVIAGLTTFLSMAYILFVNPMVLGDAGMDKGAVFTATALVSALGTIIMGVMGRLPIATAPGMGLNAFFAYGVVISMGIPWQTALAGVFMSGILFMLLTMSGLREAIINSIPNQLKHAVAAGIGLFIAFIGFQNAGIVVKNDATLVGLGNFAAGNTLLAIFGIVITIILMVRKVNAAIFVGMVVTSIVGMFFNLVQVPTQVIGEVPSLAPTFGVAIENFDQILNLKLLMVVFTFLFVDFFDTAGTLVAVCSQAKLLEDNKIPRVGKALFADSTAIIAGAVLGTSSTTSYIESSAGVAAGGRSGFTAVVTGSFFLLALAFSPLLSVVTAAVTAPALIIVGALMVTSLGEIEWNKLEIAIPAFLTLITMPLSYSIANGIALGFVLFPITMVVAGQHKKVSPMMYILSVIFLLYLIFLRH